MNFIRKAGGVSVVLLLAKVHNGFIWARECPCLVSILLKKGLTCIWQNIFILVPSHCQPDHCT